MRIAVLCRDVRERRRRIWALLDSGPSARSKVTDNAEEIRVYAKPSLEALSTLKQATVAVPKPRVSEVVLQTNQPAFSGLGPAECDPTPHPGPQCRGAGSN